MYRSYPIPEQPAPVALGAQQRILVIKLASLGDVLLATPALRALRLRYPAAHLDVLTTAGSAPLLRDSPLVDHVYTFDKYAFDEPLAAFHQPTAAREMLALGWRLRTRRYDAALLLHHLTLPFGRLKYWALLSAVGARCTIGLDNGWGAYLDVRVPDHGFGWWHEAEYNLAVAAAAGARLPPVDRAPRTADLGWGDIAPEPEPGPPVIALHPGSGSYSVARRLPVERWMELAHALREEHAAQIMLVGGPDERHLLAEIQDRLESPAWLTLADTGASPRGLAETLSRCALLVANDSFPMHLAAMVGTPVIGIFGPSNARAWGPYTPNRPRGSIIVRRSDLPCSPCFYRGQALGTPQGCPERPCLTALPLQPVLAAARRLLAAPLVGAGQAG